jgi:hypothetical protein
MAFPPEKQPSSVEQLDERKLVAALAGAKKPALVNEHEHPIEEMVHPLAFSLDVKTHEGMQAIPMNYKFQRSDFAQLVDELKKKQ